MIRGAKNIPHQRSRALPDVKMPASSCKYHRETKITPFFSGPVRAYVTQPLSELISALRFFRTDNRITIEMRLFPPRLFPLLFQLYLRRVCTITHGFMTFVYGKVQPRGR